MVYGTIVLVGGSRGIGAAAAQHFAPLTQQLISVSRTPADAGTWVQADVATAEGLDAIVDAVGDAPLDALLYLGGIWEEGAFTSAYDFAESPPEEVRKVIDVNLTAPILLAQRLAPSLARSANPRVVLIGSTAGLENAGDPEVATAASKSGLRGAGDALNVSLRPLGIGVTVIHPANVATPEVQDDIAEGLFAEQEAIPLDDVTATIAYVLSLSPATTPSTITLHQKRPG